MTTHAGANCKVTTIREIKCKSKQNRHMWDKLTFIMFVRYGTSTTAYYFQLPVISCLSGPNILLNSLLPTRLHFDLAVELLVIATSVQSF
jgi:hypothetical protein